jgi:release factor glutamine methyltransferase
VRRRAAREPLQYVLGHADFYGLRLRVTPAVLIPRPETERVVERALALIADVPTPRVVDVGTGSGCIACAVAHERPTARVVGCDVSTGALAVARANADALGLPIAFGEADLTAPAFPAQVRALLGRPGGPPPEDAATGGDALSDAARFDLVVSNPPYVPDAEADALAPEVREHEPPVALFTGADPLVCYRALARHAAALLRPGGRLVTETHADYAADVAAVFRDAGLADVRTERDLAGRPRLALARRPPTAPAQG